MGRVPERLDALVIGVEGLTGENMPNEIESIIDEGVNSQIRGLAVKAMLAKAGDITLDKLADLRGSERYGPVMKEVTLQELIDAYVSAKGLVEPGDEPRATVVAAPSGGSSGKKKTKKKASRKNGTRSKGKGGGGGSAAPGRKVNFRDADAKQKYAEHVEQVIEQRGGEPVSTTELTDICGGSSNQARDILQGLVDAGKVVSTGQARATRYYWRAGASPEVIAEFESQVPQPGGVAASA